VTSSDSIQSITPLAAVRFLTARHWVVCEHPNQSIWWLKGRDADNDEVSLVLPRTSSLADSTERLSETVDRLAQILKMPRTFVISSMLKEDRDTLRLRVPITQTSDSVSLEVASTLIPKWRDFVTLAACSQIDPKPLILRTTKAGRNFAKDCRFAHTYRGSFGFTIEVVHQVHPELMAENMPHDLPFTRTVTQRIARGLQTAKEAIEKNDPDILVQGYATGLNANMCDILGEVQDALPNTPIEYSVDWSSFWEVPQGLEKVTFTPSGTASRTILKAASETLSRLEVPATSQEITGRIIELKSKAPPLDIDEFKFAERSIALLWEVEKGTSITLHFNLPLDTYKLACTAHSTGHMARVIGTPVKHARFWYLENVESFTLL